MLDAHSRYWSGWHDWHATGSSSASSSSADRSRRAAASTSQLTRNLRTAALLAAARGHAAGALVTDRESEPDLPEPGHPQIDGRQVERASTDGRDLDGRWAAVAVIGHERRHLQAGAGAEAALRVEDLDGPGVLEARRWSRD